MKPYKTRLAVALMMTGAVALPLPLLAQTPPADAVAGLLPAQPPEPAPVVEDEAVRVTRALNAEVAAQNQLADNAWAAQRQADELIQRDAAAQWSVGAAEVEARNQAALREAADAQTRYDRAMADWRATVAACERGDRARCRAGSLPPRVPNP